MHVDVEAIEQELSSLKIIKKNNIYQSQLESVLFSIERNISRIGNRNPKIGNSDYSYQFCGPADWVSGFWCGQLWLSYMVTAKSEFKNSALLRKKYFKTLLNNPDWTDHDLGFQFSLSAVAAYELTGDKESKQQALTAADLLLARFRRIGKYIVAWNETHELGLDKTQGKTIIDSLQNLSLLFWASDKTSNPVYRNAAVAHAETMMTHIVREDYSTFHVFDFDPLTQKPIRGGTFQGAHDDSCWSRGQAWAIHGFAQIYKNTGDGRYLALAKNLAEYAMKRIPSDGVPKWDYSLLDGQTPYRDSSAGAITAAGLLSIAEFCSQLDERDKYTNWARKILDGLIQECDLTGNSDAQGLLNQGASFVNADLVDNMLPYGDYYYLESLMRINGYTEFFW